MSNSQLIYGETSSEKLARESQVSRQIINEINQFGINDRQRWLIIYYLSLELENVDEMKSLSTFIRDKKMGDLFISKIYGSDDSDGEEKNG